jgi:O-antigen/teichoic acid export membrane protein
MIRAIFSQSAARRITDVLGSFAAQRSTNLAFLDQMVVSGANFLAGILLARGLGLYEFGRFALAWMLIEFAGSLQFAAIIQPMLNIGPKQEEADSLDYYNAVVVQQGLTCLALGSLAGIAVTAAGWIFSDPQLYELAIPLFLATVAYQLHNFLRRYFFLRDRGFAALCNDALRFATQIAAIAMLAALSDHPTAVSGIWIIAFACAVSTLQGACFFGCPRPKRSVLREVWGRHWQFSKWLLPSALMFWTTSQAFVLMSGFVLGPAVTGAVKVALSMTGLLNILLLALDNFAPAQAARAWHAGGRPQLRRYMLRLGCLTGVLIFATVGILNIDPAYFVRLLFGRQYESTAYLVHWFSAPAAVYGISTVLIIWTAAMEKTRPIFLSYAMATAFTLIAAYPMTRYGGLAGVAFGSLLVESIRVIVLWMPLRHEAICSVERPRVEVPETSGSDVRSIR